MLPCIHDTKITNQVQPTIDLLVDMDELHPDVLLEHSIQPEDYKNSLVFRSAVESIRGRFIGELYTCVPQPPPVVRIGGSSFRLLPVHTATPS